MNIPNTSGPPMIATVPERTPACSQAASNEAPAGFHSVALGLDGSGASAPIDRVSDDPLSPRRVRLILVGIAAVHDQVGAIEGGGEELLVALELQFVRHHAVGVRQHAVGGHDDIAVDAQRRHGVVARRMLFRNRLHHAGDRAALTVGSLASLMTVLVILRQGLHRRLGPHLHDLVAAGLQLAQQLGQRFARCASGSRASG